MFTNQSKNSSTFTNVLRHGRDTVIGDVANKTFNDEMFSDGTLVKDTTFEQLQDTVWANKDKSLGTSAQADYALADVAIVGTYSWELKPRN